MNRWPKESGFNLIEWGIVVAIIGLIAAIVVPNLAALLGRKRDQNQSAEQSACEARGGFWEVTYDHRLTEPTAYACTSNGMRVEADR